AKGKFSPKTFLMFSERSAQQDMGSLATSTGSDGSCFSYKRGCARGLYLSYISRAAAIASDVLLLAFTWARTAAVWRSGLEITDRPSLTAVVLRDGTLYFAMLMIMNIIALFLTALKMDTDDGTAFANSILPGANLIARFILDLRSVYEEGPHSSTGVSTIQFSPRTLAGNMGAPLGIEDSAWVSSPAEDVADNHDEDYEDAAIPFGAGLGLEIDVPLKPVMQPDADAELGAIALNSIAGYLLPELLSQVFWHIVADAHVDWLARDDYAEVDPPPRRMYWTSQLGMISRHWRDVMISSHRLWSIIDVRDLSTLQSLLCLSGQAPLCVLITAASQDDAVSFVLKELQRIERLYIHCPEDDVRKSLSSVDCSTTNLPLLRHFLTHQSSWVSGYDDDAIYPAISPGFDTSGDKLPNLTTLLIHRQDSVGVVPLIRSHPSLTRLNLRYLSSALEGVDEWLDILARLPLLEHLELVYATDTQAPCPDYITWRNSHRATKPVFLPRLRFLNLVDTGTGMTCAILINHLRYPVDCVIGFGTTTLQTNQNLQLLMSNISDLWYHAPPPTKLLVHYCTQCSTDLELYADPSHTAKYSDDFTYRMKLLVGANAEMASDDDPFSLKGDEATVVALPTLPIAHVEELYVSASILYASTWWKAFFQMAQVERLECTHYSSYSLPSALRWTHSSEDTDHDPHILFPKLKVLLVDGVNFNYLFEDPDAFAFQGFTNPFDNLW
ncbi:hypothetical protein EIP91_011972, partial [Steccherinum ochraceum]